MHKKSCPLWQCPCHSVCFWRTCCCNSHMKPSEADANSFFIVITDSYEWDLNLLARPLLAASCPLSFLFSFSEECEANHKSSLHLHLFINSIKKKATNFLYAVLGYSVCLLHIVVIVWFFSSPDPSSLVLYFWSICFWLTLSWFGSGLRLLCFNFPFH